MSILIKGMEMPTSCRVCMFSRTDIRNVDWCVLTEKDLPCDCPLVPIPPHGRLIDADALMMQKGNCYDADGHLLYAVGTGNIMCAPTIIPASKEGE